MFNQSNRIILSVILEDDLGPWVEGRLGLKEGVQGGQLGHSDNKSCLGTVINHASQLPLRPVLLVKG